MATAIWRDQAGLRPLTHFLEKQERIPAPGDVKNRGSQINRLLLPRNVLNNGSCLCSKGRAGQFKIYVTAF
jgi:hypothetical protein